MKNKLLKKILLILQILILLFSCFSFSAFAINTQEEIETNPDVGWITFQAYVDPNAETNMVKISLINLNTGNIDYSCTLDKVNDFKAIVEFTDFGKFQIDGCYIENDPFFKFSCETPVFEVVPNKNSLVTFNVGDPNAELITEPEETTKEYFEFEDVTDENITEYNPDINIIENETENNEEKNMFDTLTTVISIVLCIAGVLLVICILLIIYIRKRNQ